jgi:hypothetical protein
MSLAFSTIRNTIYNLGGVVKPGSEPEETVPGFVSASPAIGEPSGPAEFIPVTPPQFGLNLASFGSSITRTFLIGEVGGYGRLVPFHFANAAAVILHRDGGKLRQALKPLLEDYLLVPFKKLPNQEAINELKEYNLPFLDTGCESDAFVEMRHSAVNASYEAARKLFSFGVDAWRENFGGEGQVLAIAGTLADVLPETSGSDLIAISDASLVLETESEGFTGNLPVGQMTHPFSLDNDRRYFYLRIRDNTLRDPGHGLLRVEFIPVDGVSDSDYSKALAFYVLSERLPINPAVQGTNEIFPLAVCKNYLLEFAASQQTVNSYFGRRD